MSMAIAVVIGLVAVGAIGLALLGRLQVRALEVRLVAAEREREQLVRTQADLAAGVVDGVAKVRHRVLEAALRAVPQAQAVALLEPRERGQVFCVQALGERFEAYRGLMIERVPELVCAAMSSGKTATLLSGASGMHPSDASAIASVVAIDGGDRAILYIASSHQEAWSTREAVALERLAAIAAPAYRLAKDREFLRERAIVDALSGCVSKVAFEERVVEEVGRAGSVDRISVIYIDADHFKSWNDSYGHNSGDKLIERLGRLYRSFTLTPLDIVGRTGGDEFCIALMNCDKTAAIRRAIELLDAIAGEDRADLVPAGRDLVQITGSLGVATYPADASNGRDLIKAADSAMYHAKNNGRNRVSYHSGREIVSVSEWDRSELLREKRDLQTRPFVRRGDAPKLHAVGDE